MGSLLKPIAILFRFHKLKMLAVIGLAVVFAVLLFPNDDLGDWLSMQVSRNTGIYVQFDHLGFEIWPGPGVSMTDLLIDPKGVPSIKAQAASTSLMLSKLLTLKLGVTASINKLFHGDVDLQYAQGDKAGSGVAFDDVTVHAEQISLDELCDYLRTLNLVPLKVQGMATLDSTAHVDHLFTDQPNISASMTIPALSIPSQSVMVDFNGVPVPQVIPTLDLGRVALKNMKLNDGVLDIPELTIGDAKSELFGKMRGTVAVQMKKMPMGVQPDVKTIDVSMDLTIDKGFIDRNQKTMIGGFLMLIPANLKSDTSKGTRLAFHMKLARPGDVPNFTPLTEKL